MSSQLDEADIFNFARKLDSPTAREQYLQQACGADDVLRAKVSRLLGAYDEQPSFLAAGANGLVATIDQPFLERPGTMIGPYKLLQQIGEGGMGVVYMAEQTQPVQRKVALKVIKAGMDTHQVVARFEAERQALAMMDHVNIARVLDAGTTEAGRPYFVMELVHGVPITKYCDDNHLTPRQRLELFVPVCQAIQHAHQKGIIHRDIKPSNVMVTLYDGKPVPKVIDFGVAKATEQKLTERTLFTQYGTMVGTLEYMSPEQAEMSALGIDTRSDIYSLGVLLYELLTGSTPISHKRVREAAYAEILRLIKEEEPPRPSTRLTDSGEALASISAQRQMEPAKLTKLVRGELDWIVMKTLEKDRNRRYETANGFAADVQRYLNDEPVQACPPSARYRFRKFARRNSVALTTVAFVVVALVMGTLVSTWQAIRAGRAETLAQKRLEAEEEQRKEAVANLQKAREAVDQMLTRVAEEQLLDVPQLEPLRKALLQDALKFYQGFLKQKGNDPALRLGTSEAWRRVGLIHHAFAEYAQEEKAYQAAITDLESLAAEFPADPAYRILLAEVHANLAWSYMWRLDKLPQAERALQRAMQLRQPLAREFPEEPDHQRALADIQNFWGNVHKTSGRAGEAEEAYRHAVELSDQLVHRFPTDAQSLHSQIRVYKMFGALLMSRARSREAEDIFRRTLVLEQDQPAELRQRMWNRSTRVEALFSLALCINGTGRTADAEKLYRQALELAEPLSIDYPSVPWLRMLTAMAQRELGVTLESQNRPTEVEELYRRAMLTTRKVIDEFTSTAPNPNWQDELFWSEERLVKLLESGGRGAEAEQVYRQALAFFEKRVADLPAVPDYRRELARRHHALGDLLRGAGRTKEAEQFFRQAIAIQEKLAAAHPSVPDYQTELARSHSRLGILLRIAGRAPEAESEFGKAYRLWRVNLNPEVENAKKAVEAEPTNVHRWHDLGVAHLRAGDWQAAIDVFEKHGGSAWQWFYLAMAHWESGNKEEAHAWYFKSLNSVERTQEKRLHHVQAEAAALLGLPDSWERSRQAWDFSRTATDLAKQGEQDKAGEANSKAIDSYEKLLVAFPAVPAYRTKLVDLLNTSGRGKDVERVDRETVSRLEKLAAAHPKIILYRQAMGQLNAELGRWDEATADLAKAVDLGTTDLWGDWYPLALLHLRAGRTNEYRQLCERLLAQFGKTENPHSAIHVVIICNRLPDAVADRTRLVQIAESAVAREPDNFHFVGLLGDTLYRKGEFEAAIPRLEESIRSDGSIGIHWRRLFLSMAQHHLGRTEEAQQNLHKAVSWIDKNAQTLTWAHRLDLELLRHETEMTLKSKK